MAAAFERRAKITKHPIICVIATIGFVVGAGGVAGAFPGQQTLDLSRGERGVGRCGFAIARDIYLSFDHTLGEEEAKRRVAARLEVLRAQFADKIGASTIVWDGDTAHVRATAFGQTAVAQVVVGDTNVQIQVHLPVLLSPLGGNIQAFLTKTAIETLKP